MKIHIVQKGDTLWDIAEKHHVDFDELQEVNSHLSSPDMLMPGMKVMIPSTSQKLTKEEKDKDLTIKPLKIKEDDHQVKKDVSFSQPELASMKLPVMPSEQKVKEKSTQKQSLKEKLYNEKDTNMYPQAQMSYEEQPNHQYPVVPYCCCYYMHHYSHMNTHNRKEQAYEQPRYVGHLPGIYHYPQTQQRPISDVPTFPMYHEPYKYTAHPMSEPSKE